MPEKLPDEKIVTILETYADLDSLPKTAETVGHSQSTVEKYVSRAKKGEIDPDIEIPDGVDAFYETFRENLDDTEPLADPKDEVADILAEFFETIGEKTKLRESVMNFLVVDECREHGDIPSAADLFGEILSGTTGVDNQTVAQRIVARYERLIQNNPTIQRNVARGDISIGSLNWGQGQHQGQPQYPGNPQRGQPQAGGMGMNGGTPQMGGMGGMGANPMMALFQELNSQIESLRDEVRSDRSRGQQNTIEEKTQEFLRQKLNRLIESESTAEQEAIISELRSLRQEMQAGTQQTTANVEGDWRAMVVQMAQTGEMSPQEAKELLQQLDESNKPVEVLEKEYEKQIREKELEHETQRYERIGGMFENLTDRFGKAFGEAIVENGINAPTDNTAGDTADASAERDEPEAHDDPMDEDEEELDERLDMRPEAGPGAEAKTCDHCGANLVEGPNYVACPECEFSIQPCDRCTAPVTVPPMGQETHGGCGECEAILEFPDDPTEPIECDECGWTGTRSDTSNHFVYCENCETHRPVVRKEQMVQQRRQIREILGD